MRTTLSLDDDVTRLLDEEVRRTGESFKSTVNRCLRVGLTASGHHRKKRFVVTPRPLGLPKGLSYDNVEELIDALEGTAHK